MEGLLYCNLLSSSGKGAIVKKKVKNRGEKEGYWRLKLGLGFEEWAAGMG